MAGLVQIRANHPQGEGVPRPAVDVGGDAPRPAGRVYIETFGCQMNEADSALIFGQLERSGWSRARGPEDADLVLINTCAVREKAEERVWGRASQLLDRRKENPDLVIGIAGCMAEHLREKIADRAPYVGLIVGPDAYRDIAALAARAREGQRVVDVRLDRTEVYEGLDGNAQDDGVSAFVTIQRGCDKFCTFCVVPYTRGRERGVAPREILRQVEALAARGYREVTLLGQTVNSYRWEDVGFAELLRAVARVEGIARVRFTSPYPVDFSPALIDALTEVPELMPYVHLPAQSGSDRVLARMKRGYDRTMLLDLIARLRDAVPSIAISTDLMVGFPGETEADHAQTLALLDEVRFDFAFMFAYSDRGITWAAKHLPDDIAADVKQRRLGEIIARQHAHTAKRLLARVGEEVEILVARPSKRGDKLAGKTPQFENVLLPLDSAAPGAIVRRRVVASSGHSLFVE